MSVSGVKVKVKVALVVPTIELLLLSSAEIDAD
jgi:hypothetical protein